MITTEQKNNKSVYNLDNRLNLIDLSINYNREISYFHPKNLIKTIAHFFKLNKVINKIQPDIIISVSTSPEQYLFPIFIFIIKKS